jgi:hypothetical protein
MTILETIGIALGILVVIVTVAIFLELGHRA